MNQDEEKCELEKVTGMDFKTFFCVILFGVSFNTALMLKSLPPNPLMWIFIGLGIVSIWLGGGIKFFVSIISRPSMPIMIYLCTFIIADAIAFATEKAMQI